MDDGIAVMVKKKAKKEGRSVALTEAEYRKQEHDLEYLIGINANNEAAKRDYEAQLKELRQQKPKSR